MLKTREDHSNCEEVSKETEDRSEEITYGLVETLDTDLVLAIRGGDLDVARLAPELDVCSEDRQHTGWADGCVAGANRLLCGLLGELLRSRRVHDGGLSVHYAELGQYLDWRGPGLGWSRAIGLERVRSGTETVREVSDVLVRRSERGKIFLTGTRRWLARPSDR